VTTPPERAGAPEGSTSLGRPGLAGYPVNLLLRGRRVVVVGGGRIAARKLEPLLDGDADVVVVAPRVDDEIRAWADQGRCSVVVRAFEPTDLDGAWLAFTATDDPAVNRAVFAAGEQRRIWVNSADDPENCSFTLMSVVRRSDLVIAIGTGGRSPALATYLRRRLGEEIGPEYSTVLDLLSEAREAMRASGRSSEDADWQLAFRSGIVDLVREGRVEAAKELLRTCLSSSSV
jgi:siroheme synthase-like protein